MVYCVILWVKIFVSQVLIELCYLDQAISFLDVYKRQLLVDSGDLYSEEVT